MSLAVRMLSKHEAQRLTDDIQSAAKSARRSLDHLAGLVEEAHSGNVYQILGYASWTAYLSETLGETPLRLDRADRQEVVKMLTEQGMSTRAIAPIVGVDRKTVERDVRGTFVPPAEPTVNYNTGEVIEEAEEVVDAEIVFEHVSRNVEIESPLRIARVTGLDGKSYPQATPRQAPRSPLIDDARSAGFQLRKAIERLEKIKADDRFTRNKAEILAALQPHLDFANETISGL